MPPLAAELSAWTFRLFRPPYQELEWGADLATLTAHTLRGGVPEAGGVLVGIPLLVDPHRPLVEIDGLREAFPWMSLAVVGPAGAPSSVLVGLLTRVSRRGAVAIPAEHAAPSEIARAVLDAFVPEPDLIGWLKAVGRLLGRRPPAGAVEEFLPPPPPPPPPPPSDPGDPPLPPEGGGGTPPAPPPPSGGGECLPGECDTLDVDEVSVTFGSWSVAPGTQTSVTVSVRPALPGWPVALSVSEVPYSGGHHHTGRPLGQLGLVTGVTNAQGVFSTTYTASEFSGGEVVTATVFGAGAATTVMASATLEVGIGGLLPLPDGYGYLKTGSNDHHPGNHSGTPGTVSALMAIASAYAGRYPGSLLYYNDMSLEQGGQFDIGPPYGVFWQSPHASHRTGQHADVSKQNVPVGRHQSLVELFSELGAAVLPENTHWHLTF